MAHAAKTIDLSVLPDEAQRELMDFYQFLRRKYRRTRIRKDESLPPAFYQPLIVADYVDICREEIYADV